MDTPKRSLKKIPRRKAVQVDTQALVKTSALHADPLPLLIEPALPGVRLADWLRDHRDEALTLLLKHGGLLFRGFGVREIEAFQGLISDMSGELLSYTYRSTPRSQVSGDIYTSTEYPPDESIPMHNEMSYTRSWPRKIWFYSVKAAETGGETPIADSRRMYTALPEAVREKFERLGVLYVRNYGAGIDLPWSEVFQTDSREEVERMCGERGIDYEWLDDGERLRTRQLCQAVAIHPETGDPLWFNQAHLFHVSSLREDVQKALIDALGEDRLPRNTFYGDGSPIEPEALAAIRRAFDEVSVAFPWQEGDVLFLDNMLTAHGRNPFSGSRKVVVGMAEAAGVDGVEVRPGVAS